MVINSDYSSPDELRDYAQEEEDNNALQTHINSMGGAEYGV